jgi:hypothetical protein
MAKVRKALEHWVEFVNPYQRIRRSIESLTEELDSLNIGEELRNPKDVRDYENPDAWAEDWRRQSQKYSRARGYVLGFDQCFP